MRLTRTRMVIGGLVVLAGIALAGCGAADKVSTTASAAEAVRLAGQQAADESFAFEMTIEMKLDSFGEVEMAAEGAVDASSERARLSSDFMGLSMDVIVDGSTTYTRLDGTDEWYRMEVDTPQPTAAGGGFDASQQLAYLRMVSDEVSEEGTETIRGAKTTKYRAYVSFERIFEQFSGDDREMMEELSRFFEGEGFDVLVWVDGEGRPAKMEYKMDLDVQGSKVSATYVMEMFDWGKAVDIELPPASKVVDGGTAGLGSMFQ